MKKKVTLLFLLLLLLLNGCGRSQGAPTSSMPTVVTEASIYAAAPEGAAWYVDKNQLTVADELRKAGFETVECCPINDLTSESLVPDGAVIRVLIGDDDSFEAGESFRKDLPVIIEYHRLPKLLLPFSPEEAKTMPYVEVAKELVEAGFVNVVTDEIYDLDPNLVSMDYKTVLNSDGYNLNEQGLEIPFDAKLSVSGHYPVDMHTVSITVDFEENWIFSRYNVEFTFGGETANSMEHGIGDSFEFKVKEGAYPIRFVSEEDSEIISETMIEVNCDVEAVYHIQCHMDRIDVAIQNLELHDALAEHETKCYYSDAYYLRKDYEDCVHTLTEMGFAFVEAKPVADTLWGRTPAGAVTSVEIAGRKAFSHNERFDKNAEVTVFYHIPTVSFEQSAIVVTERDTFDVPYTTSEWDYAEDITISIHDSGILEQMEDGAYHASAPGATTIDAYYRDICLASCEVTIEKLIIPISRIQFPETELTVAVGSVFSLEYLIEPADANYTDTVVALSSELLEQMENGAFYAAAAGDTTVTISQDNRILGSTTVHAIDVPVEGISFDDVPLTVAVGKTEMLTFALVPSHASNIGLEVSVSNAKIAEIGFDHRGEHVIAVTGVAPGTAVVTVKVSDEIAAQKEIVVHEVMPETIAITADKVNPLLGDSGILSAEFTPKDVTTPKVEWSSTNTKIVKVGEDGAYEAVGVGTATITATHPSGVSASIDIEVRPVEVEAISVVSDWDSTKSFYKKDKMTLTAVIKPHNATDKAVTWNSSDESVATVSEKGVVKAISDGTATITATASNGISSSYEVVVAVSPQKFKFTASIKLLDKNHVGSNWSKGFEFNGEEIRSGSTVSILPGDTFRIAAWAEENDSRPDYGSFYETLMLTKEMCASGYSVEDEFTVRENGGRYSGNLATWYVKITLTPID